MIRGMLTLVVWTLVALVAAALVLVVAGAAAGGRTGSVRGFLQDFGAGVRELRPRTTPEDQAVPVRTHEPVDASLDELLAAAEVDDAPYLAVEDLTDTLARARERASRGVSGLTRR
jgi:hypothetical protein